MVFLFELSLGEDVDGFVRRWGLVPADIGEARGAWITLLTSLFLHAGWLHLAVEPAVPGRLRTAGRAAARARRASRSLYLASGVIGNLVHLLVQPTSTVPALGASGAISGLIAAHLVLFPGATLGSLAPVLFLRRGREHASAVLVAGLAGGAGVPGRRQPDHEYERCLVGPPRRLSTGLAMCIVAEGPSTHTKLSPKTR